MSRVGRNPVVLEETVNYQWNSNELVRTRPDPQMNKISNKDRSGTRFTKLKDTIQYYLDNGCDKEVETIKLFYDP